MSATTVRVDAVAAKLSAWARRCTDVRLVHVDGATREVELEHYELGVGKEAELAQTIAHDLENDASTYPSPQRYHVLARTAEAVVMGTMRFQLDGTLPVSHGRGLLEPPTEDGRTGQLMRHIENKETQINKLLDTVRQTMTQGMETMRGMLEVYKNAEQAMLAERFAARDAETMAKLLEIRTLEEETRKNATHQDIRQGVKLMVQKFTAGDSTTTTTTVDEFLNSIQADQFSVLQNTLTQDQLRQLMILKAGVDARQKSSNGKPADA